MNTRENVKSSNFWGKKERKNAVLLTIIQHAMSIMSFWMLKKKKKKSKSCIFIQQFYHAMSFYVESS